MSKLNVAARLEHLIFTYRLAVIILFVLATIGFVWAATGLRIDAGYTKQLPLKHPYMATFVKHQLDFGGANRLLVAVVARDGNMFTPAFFDTLKRATDEVFFLPGVDRAKVQSLFTPNVRFTEVVEDGIAAGNVIPDDFEPTPEGLGAVRRNILKANIVGRLVANDFSGAIISAELLEFDPQTGARLDFIAVADEIEARVRDKFDADTVPGSPVDVHIIGFAKVMGDMAAGVKRVLLFFVGSFFITGGLVFAYSQSHRLAALVVLCAVVAVFWQLGVINLLGYGIDPMSILVPFLVFAIAVSHGMQMISSFGSDVFDGADAPTAARLSFRRLLVPGMAALVTDVVGFVTILFIEIRVIQEIAIAAGIGVAAIILTNLVLMPAALSYIHFEKDYPDKLHRRARRMEPLWRKFALLTRGVPELRATSRYNVDTAVVTSKFSIGVDILNVIVETKPQGCVDYGVMRTIDDFSWRLVNLPGVQSAMDLPGIAKGLNAGWNEGSPKWRVLARNTSVLTQSVTYVPTSSGLLNADCSVMPVMLFTRDHKAQTIREIVDEVKRFEAQHGNPDVSFKLATGNVGVMAATNEAVAAAQWPIMLFVFGAVILLCLLSYWSVRATICILVPLGLVSTLSYALMTVLEIGLKVNTLPVAALGVGVGVDYGIYLYSRFRTYYRAGDTLREAYFKTLEVTGNGVFFTGLILALGVATWIFSPLKFQADMGILLAFLFLMNMIGALVLLPALARWVLNSQKRHQA